MAEGFLGWACGLAGEREEARQILADLEQLRRSRHVSNLSIATVHLGLQETEALASLERAYEERDGLLPLINLRPEFDPLRADPRFQALLLKMNLPETVPNDWPTQHSPL